MSFEPVTLPGVLAATLLSTTALAATQPARGMGPPDAARHGPGQHGCER